MFWLRSLLAKRVFARSIDKKIFHLTNKLSQAGYLYMEDILWSISNLTTTSSCKNSYHLYWYRYLAGTQKVYPDYNSTAFDAIYVADMALEYTEAEAPPRISSDTLCKIFLAQELGKAFKCLSSDEP